GLAIYENDISAAIYADSRAVVTLFVGMACILAIGLADDLFNPPAKWRLLAIVGVAAFTWLGGNQIELLEVPQMGIFELGVLSAPVTILWIVGVIVAFNFIDGLDGLAAGIALIASITMFIMALITNNVLWMTWTGAIAGSLLGFLVFNFNPASIFMGDSGSNFLGYMMAVIAIGTTQKESTGIALLIPMLVLGLPILDAALTMLRRALLREGMFLSERGHLHHRLLDMGISHRDVVLTLWGVTLLLCLGGLTFLTDVDRLQILLGVTISGTVFGLMFFTGYVRPHDLRTMWNRGLANLARDKALAKLSTDLAQTVSSTSTPDDLGSVLEKLTSDGG
ncbi:MAG: MraY family glycosyltransferase, partial [Cyanobacteriota bacterium]|nr:MraY family glycosyltransferase [Cyanobacteriota bacterium]